MERLALCYRAIPQKKQEYIRAHREIWPEIVKGLEVAGCHEMSIFMRGNSMFIYGLIENIEEFNRIRDRDSFYHKWDDRMHQLLESPFDDEEKGPFATMQEIWRFKDGKVVAI